MNNYPTGFAFSTLGCPSLDLDGVIALAKRHGITQLELRAFENRLDLPTYFAEKFPSHEALRRALADAGMRVCGVDTSLGLLEHDQAQRDSFEQFVALAEAIDAPYLRVFGGGKEPALTPAQLDKASEFYDWWRGYRKAHGIRSDIVIETHDQLIDTGMCVQLMNHIGDDMLILWDTHHIWRNKHESTSETWRQLGARVRHIHIKDSITDPESKMGYSYVPPGTGEFPLLETIAMIQRDAPDLVISLEWEKLWHPTIAPLETALDSLALALR